MRVTQGSTSRSLAVHVMALGMPQHPANKLLGSFQSTVNTTHTAKMSRYIRLLVEVSLSCNWVGGDQKDGISRANNDPRLAKKLIAEYLV